MAKILTGIVTSNAMQNTAVVEVVRRTPHPLYKKMLKRSKKYKVETFGETVKVGDRVHIQEVKPISKDKHFILMTEKKTKEVKVKEEKPSTAKTKEDKKA